MFLCCCSPKRSKSPLRGSNRAASIQIRQERTNTDRGSVVILRSKPNKLPRAEIGSNEWRKCGKEYVERPMSKSEEKDNGKIVGKSRKIKSKSSFAAENFTKKFETRQSGESKSELVSSTKDNGVVVPLLQSSPRRRDRKRCNLTETTENEIINEEFSKSVEVRDKVENDLSPVQRVIKCFQSEDTVLVSTEGRRKFDNVVREDIPIAKNETQECSAFDETGRSKKPKSQVEVLDTKILVNVTDGSRIKLRQTKQGCRASPSRFDKNEDEKSTKEKLKQNCTISAGNVALVIMTPLSQESVVLESKNPPQLLAKQKNPAFDSTITSSDRTTHKEYSAPTSVAHSHASSNQLVNNAQCHLTMTSAHLLQPKNSTQSSSHLIERGNITGLDRSFTKSKAEHNQTNTDFVLESVISEPYFKKFELATPSQSCKLSPFFTNAQSKGNTNQDLSPFEESTASGRICKETTSVVNQETPKKSLYVSNASVSLQSVHKQSTAVKSHHFSSNTEEETPAHIVEDEEDFSGVVEGPTLKVKDIRDKYKGRDYDNFAKPKSSNNNSSRKGSDELSWRSLDFDQACDDTKAPNNEVAQQVMSLFKGALDVEKELTVFEEEALRSQNEQSNQLSPAKRNGHVTTVTETTHKEAPARETRTFVKPTPGKLNSAAWPPAQPEQDEEPEQKEAKLPAESTEAKKVESFDDSLDQFYDVLNDLTS